MSTHYIPDDLLVSILLRLPTKSLVRFMCVCKAWYFLITQPNFIFSHLKRQSNPTQNQNPSLFLSEGENRHSIWRNGEEFDNRTRVGCPWQSGLDIEYFTVGSCDGLVCLFNLSREVFLWNPSIRKCLNLGLVPVGDYDSDYMAAGFGFDFESNDYKVVAITYYDPNLYGIYPPRDAYAHVYTISSGIWRSIEFPDWDNVSSISDSQALVNGMVHWIVSRYRDLVAADILILGFDLNRDEFSGLELPDSVVESRYRSLHIGVIDDSLALFHGVDQACNVWQMKKYGVEESWTMLFKIKLPCLGLSVFGFWKEGKMLMFSYCARLVSLDINESEESYVVPREISDVIGCAFPCVESLVLLDKFSGASWCKGCMKLTGKDDEGSIKLKEKEFEGSIKLKEKEFEGFMKLKGNKIEVVNNGSGGTTSNS